MDGPGLVRSFDEEFEERMPKAGFEEQEGSVRMVVEKIEVDRGAANASFNLRTLVATKEFEKPGDKRGGYTGWTV